MDIHPIKTEQDYDNALAEVERLMDADPDTLEGDRLDLLTTLIGAYESKHYAIDIPNPFDAIKFQHFFPVSSCPPLPTDPHTRLEPISAPTDCGHTPP